MTRVDYDAIAAEMAKSAPSDAEVTAARRLVDADSREQRLREAGLFGEEGPIPERDLLKIVRGEPLYESHALRAAQRWFTVRGGGRRAFTMLALAGDTGRGKTFAGAWLIAELGGRYITAEEMVRSFVVHNQSTDATVRRAKRARVLIIDDLGTELDAAAGNGALYDLCNRRVGNSRAWTLLTANLSEEAFRNRYDKRTLERIEQCGSIMEVGGPNLRERLGE